MNKEYTFLDRAKDEKFWKAVKENPKYKIFIDELFGNYELHCKNEIAELPYNLFKLFWVDGNRTKFEEKYFSRRQRLNTTALLSLIYPENEEYFSNLQDTIWVVCNEYSWALPAHLGLSKETGTYEKGVCINEYNNIDLFAAETGFTLSEIKFLLKDRFDQMIIDRIEENLERRIIKPFLENTYFWEDFAENWAAVCGGGVGCIFLYERPDLFPRIKERLDNTMKAFLSSYKQEGICEEGVMYWEYGFGFFAAYAELLREMTNNKENWFELHHVKKIAEYSNMIFLGDKLPVTFGDSSLVKKPVSMGLMEFLRRYYGDCIPVLDLENYGFGEYCARWQRHIRSIIYFDTECEYKRVSENEIIFKPETGYFLNRNSVYDLAVTAGNNDMPHNHNDLGSFIVQYKNMRIFDDFGAGEYTKDYFDNDKRYSHFVCRSGGHSLPVINGKEQPYGKEYIAKMNYDGNLTIDLTKAYDDGNLKKFLRTFICEDNKITLRDEFDLTGKIKERFVTKIKPVTQDGILKIGDVKIAFDKELWNLTVSEDSYSDHDNANRNIPVYVIDFESDKDIGEFVMNIEFEV